MLKNGYSACFAGCFSVFCFCPKNTQNKPHNPQIIPKGITEYDLNICNYIFIFIYYLTGETIACRYKSEAVLFHI